MNTSTLDILIRARDQASAVLNRVAGAKATLRARGEALVAMGSKMMRRFTLPIVAGAGLSVRAFGNFDDAMTKSLAIMGDISGPMRKRMEDAARSVGKTTLFGASQAAEAYFFLASAGLDAEQSIAALPAVAKFAQAGAFDLAQATDLLTDSQSALGLKTKDAQKNLENMTRVGDVFVRANQLANASVEEFAEAMTVKAGAALRSLNKDVEEGTAVLAVFADQGIKGRRAGTTLTATLDGLTVNARKNAGAFKELGVAVFDSNGEMRPMTKIVGGLEQGMAGMSAKEREATLAKLGFNRQARQGILALLGNSKELGRYEDNLRDAGGAAEEVADKQLESFNAQMKLIKQRIEDVQIAIGKQLRPIILALGEAVAGLFERFTELSPTVQKFILIGLGLLAAIGPVLFIVGKLMIAMAALISPITLVVVAIALLVAAFVHAWKNSETFRNTIRRVTNEVKVFLIDMVERGKAVLDELSEFFKAAWDAIKVATEVFIAVVTDVWERFGAHILRFITNTLKSIVEILQAVFKVIKGVFQVFVGIFTGDWDKFWEGIRNIAAGIWDAVVALIRLAINTVKSIIGVVMAAISAAWSLAWATIKKIASAAWDAVKRGVRNGINAVLDFFKKLPARIFDFLRTLPGRLFAFGKEAMTSLWNGLKEVVTGLLSWVGDKANEIAGKLNPANWFSTPEEHYRKLFGAAFRSIGDEARKSLPSLGSSIDRVTDAVSLEGSAGLAAAGTASGGGAGDTFLLAEGAIQLFPRDIDQLRDIADLFDNLKQVARQRPGSEYSSTGR